MGDKNNQEVKTISNIRMIEYTIELGTCGIKRAAVFDETKISDKEVREHIMAGEEYNPNIIYMYMEQFLSVFR